MTSERGSLTLELALVVPALILMVVFISGAATIVGARSDVEDAAWEAARAASLTRNPVAADLAARSAIDRRLASERWSCTGKRVDVDVSRFRAGSSVGVSLSCALRLADAGLFLPGATHLSARASEPLDQYKAFQ
jgi:hypothetical protein